MSSAVWILIGVAGLLVGLGVYAWAVVDSRSKGASPQREPSGPAAAPFATRPRAEPVSPPRPRGNLVRFKSTAPAPPGRLPPPRMPGGGPPHVTTRTTQEFCSYCSSPVRSGEPFARCLSGHIAHQDCVAVSGGLCSVQYCGAAVSGT